jgi:hypothetical protein
LADTAYWSPDTGFRTARHPDEMNREATPGALRSVRQTTLRDRDVESLFYPESRIQYPTSLRFKQRESQGGQFTFSYFVWEVEEVF